MALATSALTASSLFAQRSSRQRAEIDSAAAVTLRSLLVNLENVDKALERKATAHRVIGKRLDAADSVFIRGLTSELKILTLLIEVNPMIAREVNDARRLAEHLPSQQTYHGAAENLASIDSSMLKLQNSLRSRSVARNRFKGQLKHVVRQMMLLEPAATSTLVIAEGELDPDMLDLALSQQRTIISSALVTLSVLQR